MTPKEIQRTIEQMLVIQQKLQNSQINLNQSLEKLNLITSGEAMP